MSSDNNNKSKSAQLPKCHYSSKYERIYWQLIEKAETRLSQGNSYVSLILEEHHPIPEFLYPENWNHIDSYWKVFLTPREHYIAHLLLGKMEMSYFGARAITRFLTSKYSHLRGEYTNLKWLGQKIVSKHGYNLPPWRNQSKNFVYNSPVVV